MNELTIIIPIHEYDENLRPYYEKVFESIHKQENNKQKVKILLVHPAKDVDKFLEFKKEIITKFEGLDLNTLSNEGDTSYQSQVNLAVNDVTTDYFSVVEFDDEVGNTYVFNFEKYTTALPDVDIFMTMIIETNTDNQGVKLTNEVVWSQQFVGENSEMGYLNIEALKEFSDFKLSGAFIKTECFKSIGMYKNNIKLTFMYELLLRAFNNGCTVFSIPKMLYKHILNRENSLFDKYQKELSMSERKFWFDTALSEYNFNNDRVIDTSLIKK